MRLLLLIVCLGEGAYRVWDAAERGRDQAERALASATGVENLGAWLDERIREVRQLRREVENLYPPSVDGHDRMDSVGASLADLSTRVVSRLRLSAPGWVDYWLTNPGWLDPVVTPLGDDRRQELVGLLDYTTEQLAHIRDNLRSG